MIPQPSSYRSVSRFGNDSIPLWDKPGKKFHRIVNLSGCLLVRRELAAELSVRAWQSKHLRKLPNDRFADAQRLSDALYIPEADGTRPKFTAPVF
jgi:hypothetical protein